MLFECTGDGVERAGQVCSDKSNSSDNHNRNASSDQAVFDGGCTRLVPSETV